METRSYSEFCPSEQEIVGTLPEFNSKTKAKSPVSFGIKGDFACCTEYKNVVTWKLPYQSEILAAAAL